MKTPRCNEVGNFNWRDIADCTIAIFGENVMWPIGATSMRSDIPEAILFFDSDCLLCDRAVLWFSRRDDEQKLCYAGLQGETAKEILPEEQRATGPVPSSVVLAQRQASGEWRVSTRSDAIIGALALTGAAPMRRCLLRCLPRPLRDFGYDLIARVRYRVFGKVTACSLAKAPERDRLLP